MTLLTNDQWQEAIVQLANSGITPGAVVDTFGNATNITAATTFSGVPTVSQLAASSSVLLANPGAQATFIAEVNVASAFVGTLSFYGLEPDGTTLQAIGTHLRGIGTTAMSTTISTAVALNQVWMGSAANFKTIYVVCTAFTSGSVSVQLGLSAAPYAMAILNTVNALITNANANGQNTMLNSAPVVLASDQSNIPIVQKSASWTSIYTTTQTGVSSWAGSGDIDVHLYRELMINIQLSAITGTNIQFKGSRKDSFSNYTGLWLPAALTAAGSSNTSWGSGLSTNHLFGSTILITATFTAITSVTFTVDIQGR